MHRVEEWLLPSMAVFWPREFGRLLIVLEEQDKAQLQSIQRLAEVCTFIQALCFPPSCAVYAGATVVAAGVSAGTRCEMAARGYRSLLVDCCNIQVRSRVVAGYYWQMWAKFHADTFSTAPLVGFVDR